MIIRRQIVLLLVWNFVWLGFAVDQIQISVEALQQSNNIYGDKVVVDRNGTKFLVDKNRLKKYGLIIDIRAKNSYTICNNINKFLLLKEDPFQLVKEEKGRVFYN